MDRGKEWIRFSQGRRIERVPLFLPKERKIKWI